MKQFIIKFLAFSTFFLFTIVAGMFIPKITIPRDMHYALIDKHEMLQNTPPPRIILVGGSNLTFGIKSETIQNAFDMPVINTAVHAGMGLKYIIEDIMPYLKQGDIVILATEYTAFYGTSVYGGEPMVSSIIAVPTTCRLFNHQNWSDMLSTIPQRALKNNAKFFVSLVRLIFNIKDKGVYNRTSFNRFGDVTAHYSLPPEKFTMKKHISGEFNTESIQLIKKLQKQTELKNGHFFITYPCIAETSYKSMETEIQLINNNLKLHNFQLLGNPEKYAMPDSLFFNSSYHLVERGAMQRTLLLIEDMKQTRIAIGKPE